MKPTREEILSEPAGPRLDAWVAEYVMGWVREPGDVFSWAERDSGVATGWYIDEDPDYYACGENCRSWRPSTNIAAAWEVVEKLENHDGGENPAYRYPVSVCSDRYNAGWVVLIGWSPEEPWADDVTMINFWDDMRKPANIPARCGIARDPSAPLAISRAALLAVIEENGR